eukprot:3179953-Prymnesium_polylepis.1
MPLGHASPGGAPSVYISCTMTPRCSYHCPHDDLSLKRKRSMCRATSASVQFSRFHRAGFITSKP